MIKFKAADFTTCLLDEIELGKGSQAGVPMIAHGKTPAGVPFQAMLHGPLREEARKPEVANASYMIVQHMGWTGDGRPRFGIVKEILTSSRVQELTADSVSATSA